MENKREEAGEGRRMTKGREGMEKDWRLIREGEGGESTWMGRGCAVPKFPLKCHFITVV